MLTRDLPITEALLISKRRLAWGSLDDASIKASTWDISTAPRR